MSFWVMSGVNMSCSVGMSWPWTRMRGAEPAVTWRSDPLRWTMICSSSSMVTKVEPPLNRYRCRGEGYRLRAGRESAV